MNRGFLVIFEKLTISKSDKLRGLLGSNIAKGLTTFRAQKAQLAENFPNLSPFPSLTNSPQKPSEFGNPSRFGKKLRWL
jgi:hypothetical protein